MEIETPQTRVKIDKIDVLTEFLKQRPMVKALAESLPDTINYNDLEENLEYDFRYFDITPEEKPEYYSDGSTKCYGIPQGSVKAKLNEKAKKKLYDLRVDVDR